MKCSPFIRFGLMLGFVALMGSVPALADGPAVSCPPPVKHHVALRQHHWAHHYVTRVVWTPACGSVARPCNIEHLTVPLP
jgi:hypothetical protein